MQQKNFFFENFEFFQKFSTIQNENKSIFELKMLKRTKYIFSNFYHQVPLKILSLYFVTSKGSGLIVFKRDSYILYHLNKKYLFIFFFIIRSIVIIICSFHDIESKYIHIFLIFYKTKVFKKFFKFSSPGPLKKSFSCFL